MIGVYFTQATVEPLQAATGRDMWVFTIRLKAFIVEKTLNLVQE